MGCQVQAGALSLGVLTRDRSQQVGKCGQALVGVTDLGVWGRVGAGWSPGSGARVTVAIPCQSAHWPLARLWGCRGKQRWARVAGMGHGQPQALTLAHFSGLPLLSPGHPSGQLASQAYSSVASLCFLFNREKKSISNYSKNTLMCPERH